MAKPPASSKSRRAIVVGAGVIGLTTAVRMLEMGHSVEIWAKEIPPAVTSQIAAAFWFPYDVCPLERVASWARSSYREFARLAGDPETGVVRRAALKHFPTPVARPRWAATVPDFRDASADERLPGFSHGFAFSSFLVETPIFLPWLVRRVKALGGAIHTRALRSLDEAREHADLVINCAGLGSRELANDSLLQPTRGQIVLVEQVGLDRVLIEERAAGITYIVPRSRDIVLGGTSEPSVDNLRPDPAQTEDILQRCRALEPRLEGARVLEVKVGLRPCRDEVRLEHDPRASAAAPVIHNYGHGGAGITLSWGCADEAAALATQSSPARESS